MSPMITLSYAVDLTQPVCQTPLIGALQGGDSQAHHFLITLKNGHIPTATVTGCFVRHDHTTVLIAGEMQDNTVSLTLPAVCYSVPGGCSLIIRLSDGDTCTTVFWAEGTVVNTATDTLVDPGHTIPSLAELLAHADAAEKAAENANSLITDIRQQLLSGEFQGKPGYTPQRGADYWTDADKAEIKAYVDEAILGGAW